MIRCEKAEVYDNGKLLRRQEDRGAEEEEGELDCRSSGSHVVMWQARNVVHFACFVDSYKIFERKVFIFVKVAFFFAKCLLYL